MHYGCLSAYRRLFWWLEESGFLDCDNQTHLAVLQFVFVPRINKSLQEFQRAWNHHPLATEGNKTPLQIMFLTLPPQHYDVDPVIAEENVRIINDENGLSTFNEDVAQVEVRNWTTLLNETQLAILSGLEQTHCNDVVGTDFYINAVATLQAMNV